MIEPPNAQTIHLMEMMVKIAMKFAEHRQHETALNQLLVECIDHRLELRDAEPPKVGKRLDWDIKSLSTVDFAPYIWEAEGPFWNYEVHLSKDGKYIAWEAGVDPFDTLEEAQNFHQNELDRVLAEWIG